MSITDDIETIAIALYVKDGGLVCEWHAADLGVRHAYRLLATKEKAVWPDGAGGGLTPDRY